MFTVLWDLRVVTIYHIEWRHIPGDCELSWQYQYNLYIINIPGVIQLTQGVSDKVSHNWLVGMFTIIATVTAFRSEKNVSYSYFY